MDFLFLAVGLGLSTGFVEELVFRGIMQPHAIEAFGERVGLVGVAAVDWVTDRGFLRYLTFLDFNQQAGYRAA